MGGWWRWALVSPDGVAPSQTVGVSVSVNLPLHHKVQKFSSGTSSPGWSRKKGCKTVVVWLQYLTYFQLCGLPADFSSLAVANALIHCRRCVSIMHCLPLQHWMRAFAALRHDAAESDIPNCFVMAALWNRACHYIFVLWFFFFFLLFFLA